MCSLNNTISSTTVILHTKCSLPGPPEHITAKDTDNNNGLITTNTTHEPAKSTKTTYHFKNAIRINHSSDLKHGKYSYKTGKTPWNNIQVLVINQCKRRYQVSCAPSRQGNDLYCQCHLLRQGNEIYCQCHLFRQGNYLHCQYHPHQQVQISKNKIFQHYPCYDFVPYMMIMSSVVLMYDLLLSAIIGVLYN